MTDMPRLAAPVTAMDGEIVVDGELGERLPVRIVIDEEAMLVTGYYENRWIVRRGIAGSDPVDHAANTLIERAYALYGTAANAGLSAGGAHPGLASHESLGLAGDDHTHPAPDLTHDHDSEYAPIHLHPYAADDHTHAGGAEHPDLATHEQLGLAGDDHTHDTTHDHDADYSATAHAHSEYATDDDLTAHASTTHGTQAHAISGVQHTGTLDHSALGSVTANQHHNQAHALGGADHSGSLAQAAVTNLESDLAGKAATGHDHDSDYAAASHAHLDADIPSGIARDAEVTSAIATHAATPHGGESAEAFPVGSVFLSVVSTNPATLLGYGTWSQIAGGRFLVGQSADAAYDTAEETGGAATHTHADHTGIITHTHSTDSQGAHVHAMQRFPTATGGSTGFTVDTSMSGTQAAANDTASGGTHTHTAAAPAGAVNAYTHDSPSNVPPYFVVYAWKRTA